MNPMSKGIYDALAGAAGLTALLSNGANSIYQSRGEEGANPPYVIYQKQSGVPVHTLTRIAYENQVYLVKAVTLGATSKAAGDIAAQINLALEDQAITVAGYTLMFLRRIGDVDYPEPGPGGQEYRHLGSLFRIMAT